MIPVLFVGKIYNLTTQPYSSSGGNGSCGGEI